MAFKEPQHVELSRREARTHTGKQEKTYAGALLVLFVIFFFGSSSYRA
jgi:hypothetical protein